MRTPHLVQEPLGRAALPCAVALVLWMGAGTVSASTDASALVRQLYGEARYDEALDVLNGAAGGEGTNEDDRRELRLYRFLCLFALGRTVEAAAAAGSLIDRDPLYTPGEQEAAPRVRQAYADQRRTMLPDVATRLYLEARRRYDEENWEAAARGFDTVVALVDDADMQGRLRDLRLLAGEFRGLSLSKGTTLVAAPLPRAVAPPPTSPAPPVDVAERAGGAIYERNDTDVVPPAIVRQDIPAPADSDLRGIVRLEIVIGKDGLVERATLREPLSPEYDPQLIAAAAHWRYTPASRDGHAVRYRKTVTFELAGR